MRRQNLRAVSIAALLVVLLAAVLLLSGCSSNSTGPAPASTMVRMSALFTKSGTPGLFKGTSLTGVDSLRIDSAIVVIAKIKFLQHADSVTVDSGAGHEGDGEHHEDLDHDSSIVFRGPFVVHVHDTISINFANHLLPAGVYDGIVFKIHRLESGEDHEDADEHHQGFREDDSSAIGASIVVWGAVHKDSTWHNFTFMLNDELKFKVKGNFTVPALTSTVSIALNVNMGSWFRSPVDGTLLDPTDTSDTNRWLIRQAIANAFGACRGGHDDGDGHPE